ncbi:MAG: V-type ATP synthase subunit E [Clostridia bacterium]|nr:V-type ATP synthase subunit E [Clostridia bacterium]
MESGIMHADAGQALVDKIISEAEETAETLAEAAETYYSETVEKAEEQAAEYSAAQKAKAEEQAKELLSRKNTLFALERRKAYLAAKQSLVQTVYVRAVNKLNAMDKAEYLAFVDKLVGENAESGETVIISEDCPLSEEEVAAQKSVKALGLSVKKCGKFGGGIVLSGKKADKDLSFKSLCDSVRETTEAEIAHKLFG